MDGFEYIGDRIPRDTGDARSIIARTLAGPHISNAFGMREVHVKMGVDCPPDGVGPGVATRAREAWTNADLILNALAAADYQLAGPGEVVVRLPEPDGHAVPETMEGQPGALSLPYWVVGDGLRLFPGDPDSVLYDDPDEAPAGLERDGTVLLALARWASSPAEPTEHPAGER